MASRLTVKGQVTIPKMVREHLGVGPGDEVEFAIMPGGVEIVKSDDEAKLRAAIADIQRRRTREWDGMSTDEYMAMIRDEP